MTEASQRAEWLERIPCLTPTRAPKAVLANAIFALEQAPEWNGVLLFDEFTGVIVVASAPPWLSGQNMEWHPRQWVDTDDARATEWLHHQGIFVSQQVAASAVMTVAQAASFHPLKDYLEGLKWDGKKRLDKFAAKYLGAEDTPYHAAAGKTLCLSAVARTFQPGCKADTMTILEGGQGTFKSSALEAMFHPWFSDDIADLGSKDAAMQTRSAWCIEVAELASMTKAEVEKVKAFVSRRVDRYRPSYGRNVIEQPRTCIFAGTTNTAAYLKDETGGRRYLPIKCGYIDLDAIKRDRNQMWAEAVALYRKGEAWWLVDTDVIEMAREEQAARYVPDAWGDVIADYVKDKSETSVSEVLQHALFMDKAKWDRASQSRAGQCLTALDWERRRQSVPDETGKRLWKYHRPHAKPTNGVGRDEEWDE